MSGLLVDETLFYNGTISKVLKHTYTVSIPFHFQGQQRQCKKYTFGGLHNYNNLHIPFVNAMNTYNRIYSGYDAIHSDD